MTRPCTHVYLHLVWSTVSRQPMLDASVRERVFRCLRAKCRELACTPVAVGGVSDHVHVLVRIPPVGQPSELVRQLKGVSSHLLNAEVRPGGSFKWQGGYGAFSVSLDSVEEVRQYVENQERHHQDGTVMDDWERAEEATGD